MHGNPINNIDILGLLVKGTFVGFVVNNIDTFFPVGEAVEPYQDETGLMVYGNIVIDEASVNFALKVMCKETETDDCEEFKRIWYTAIHGRYTEREIRFPLRTS